MNTITHANTGNLMPNKYLNMKKAERGKNTTQDWKWTSIWSDNLQVLSSVVRRQTFKQIYYFY